MSDDKINQDILAIVEKNMPKQAGELLQKRLSEVDELEKQVKLKDKKIKEGIDNYNDILKINEKIIKENKAFSDKAEEVKQRARELNVLEKKLNEQARLQWHKTGGEDETIDTNRSVEDEP